MFRSTWQDFSEKIRTWWICDRIRVSPREGRLLRIQVGDLLTICGSDFEVIERSTVLSETGQLLQLTCRTESGFAMLVVEVNQHLIHQTATLTQFGIQQTIDADDVQIWPRCVFPAAR